MRISSSIHSQHIIYFVFHCFNLDSIRVRTKMMKFIRGVGLLLRCICFVRRNLGRHIKRCSAPLFRGTHSYHHFYYKL